MFRIALKSLFARKRRLFTTGAAIVLSVAFISGTFVITGLMTTSLNSLVSASQRGVAAIVRSTKAQAVQFGQPLRELVDSDTLELTRAAKGVRAAEGLILAMPTLIDPDGDRIQDTFGPPTIAFNWVDEESLRGGSLAPGGRAPAAPNEIVLDVRTAKEFGFKLGDPITAQFPGGLEKFTIVGFGGLQPKGSTKLVAGPRVVLLEESTARTLFKKGAGFDYISVAANDGVSQKDLVATLRKILPPQTQALTGAAYIKETESSISTIIGLFTAPILAFGWISAFVAAFVIYNTFAIIVAQRTREMALLRAVGASRRQLLGSVILEAVMVGLVASGLGILFGWLLANALKAGIQAALPLPDGVPPLTLPALQWGLIVGLGATVISALIPAFRATQIPPIAALSASSLDRSNLSRGRKIAGPLIALIAAGFVWEGLRDTSSLGLIGVAIGAGLLFVDIAVAGPLFAGPLARTLGAPLPKLRGVAGTLARQNAARNPKRTATTAAALSIGVGLVTVVTVFAASVRSTSEAQISNQLANVDLIVDSGTGFGGLGPGAREFIAAQPQVQRFTPIRFGQFTLLNSKGAKELQAQQGETKDGFPVGESKFGVGLDPVATFKMIRFDGLTPKITALKPGEVLVLEKTATENGWKAGDSIELSTQRGKQTWKIAATMTSRVGSGAEYLTDLETISAISPPEFQVDQTLWIQLNDGLDAAKVRQQLRPGLKAVAPAAGINTVADYLGERLGIVDSVVNLIYVLLGLSIVVALVGVGNTISLSIYERSRELGLLRAVGAARAQIRSSVRWESVIIALAGTVAGLLIGVVMSVLLVNAFDQPGLEPVVEPSSMLIIGFLGAFAGVVAGLRPARRASRANILAAIASI
jgi:putative ABC transport system permease protein